MLVYILLIQYWHVFSLQSRDTTVLIPFSLSLWTRSSIPESIQCFYNSLPYFGNTDQVHLACKQESTGCLCRCAQVSVKSKQMQLASIRCSRAVDWWSRWHTIAYCVISVEVDDNTYDGKTAGSHNWEVRTTVNSLLGTLFHVIITRTGTNLMFFHEWDPQ